MTDLYEKYILLFISKHYGITKNRETIYHRKHTVSPEIIIFYKGNMLMEFQTKLLHGKAVDNYANGSTVPPISLANAFAYESSEQLEKVFQNRAPGFAYTRIANPTVDAFERRVNELEGGIGGVACSSGMSAVTLSLLNILQAGDEVIAGSALFGGTLDLLHDLEAFGIKVHFIPRVEMALIEPFLTDKTRAVFGEIVGNPALNVMDVRETADFLHGKGVPLIVDSTTSTPYLINPIQYGADVVVHSTSKYINGSGDAISGIIIDSGNFDWDAYGHKYHGLTEPDESYHGVVYTKQFGKKAYITKATTQLMRDLGSIPSPENCFLLNLGLETLPLRVERHCENAQKVAEFLDAHEKVSHVIYAGLPDDKYHELAQKYMDEGRTCGVISFELTGGRDAAVRFMDGLKLANIATHVAASKTMVLHPASHTHRQMNDEQLREAGVSPGMIRLSVGIESAKDIINDLKEALKNA